MSSDVRDLSAGDPSAQAGRLAAAFEQRHRRPAQGVHAAPGRVNLIGEHLDYNGGRCLPLTLPHACFVAVAPRPDDTVTLRSLQDGADWEGTVDRAGPGQVHGWVGYAAGVLWAMAAAGIDLPGMDLVVDSQVPLGAGLSSSAALECAVALAAAATAGLQDDESLRERLVAACMRAENDVVGAPTGGLDQSAALLGAPGEALLVDFAGGPRRRVAWRPQDSGLSLMVIDTGAQHALDDGGYGSRRQECEEAARRLELDRLTLVGDDDLDRLEEPLRRRARHVLTETTRVSQTVAALDADRIREVGAIFTASHASLRDDFEVSCDELDVAVDEAVAAGALGARMTGGGFGGSAIALVPTHDADAVAARVGAAFARHGWGAPGVATLTEGTPAGRVRS